MAGEAFKGSGPACSIPQQRVIEKMDAYMARRDYAGAERHLLYWLDEALELGDARGELMVRNELVGHFRKTGNKDRALEHAQAALDLLDSRGFAGTISAGTTYTNVGTACNAFGDNERAIEMFSSALQIYEGSGHTAPSLLGGLYNNMALACIALGRFDEADAYYEKALEAMGKVENGELEQAITYLNMADAAVARARAAGEDEAACEKLVEANLDKALDLLDTPSVPRDGYYAFVCEKCAPVFGHYGYFLADGDLRERARGIYERA